MKTIFVLLILLSISHTSLSQQNILDKKSKIKKRVEKYYEKTKRKYTVTETDSTVTYALTDSITLPATYVYYFNEQGRCEKEETIYSCDSCMQKGVELSLKNKFINWKKISATSHYAGFPYYTLMEPVNVNGQFILRFTRIKRKDL